MSSNQVRCLISDSRGCKASAQTDLVFIIGSGSEEFSQDIKTIQKVLCGFNFPSDFALLSEKSKGLDVFCDKICSKIREAQFCVVMLNDSLSSQLNTLRVPSANVYYEFGLAVAQSRGVIPIIRRGFKIPFDVQHLDAIIYDDLADLDSKLKNSIVGTLRKQQKPMVDSSSSELQSLVYGPLYNEVDSFILRTKRFSAFTYSNYSNVLEEYKYLFDKTDQAFQKNVRKFYNKIQELNRQLLIAERKIQQIVASECIRFFKIEGSSMPKLKVEVTSESGFRVIPTFDQILLQKVAPELYFKTIEPTGEKVILTKFFMERSGVADRVLSSEESSALIKVCEERVERDQAVIALRRLASQSRTMAKKLRGDLKRMC